MCYEDTQWRQYVLWGHSIKTVCTATICKQIMHKDYRADNRGCLSEAFCSVAQCVAVCCSVVCCVAVCGLSEASDERCKDAQDYTETHASHCNTLHYTATAPTHTILKRCRKQQHTQRLHKVQETETLKTWLSSMLIRDLSSQPSA